MLQCGGNKIVIFYEILKERLHKNKTKQEEIISEYISSIHKKGDRKVFAN